LSQANGTGKLIFVKNSMKAKPGNKKRLINNLFTFLLAGSLILVLVSPDAKAWVLKQMISVGLFNSNIKSSTASENSKVAGSFSFRDDKGKVLSTADLKGKVVFINFWATWCPPCRAEMPSMHSMYNKLKADDRFVFLFLNEDEDKSKARKYLDENNYTFPLQEATTNVPADIFSGTLPTTVVIDKEGKIVMKKEGMSDYNRAKFIEQLKGLL